MHVANSINANEASNAFKTSNEVHIFIRHGSKLHTDQIGKFPYVSRQGNQCIMIAYVVDPNVILAVPFKSKTKEHLTAACLQIKNK